MNVGGTLIPKLDLRGIRTFTPAPVVLPCIEKQFAANTARFQALQEAVRHLNGDSDQLKQFVFQGIEYARSTLGLMQAITGNESDSHAERIRKEHIPDALQKEILAETKELQG